ncbi:hypothetical protein ACHAXM_003804 [Skeletonema potamos]
MKDAFQPPTKRKNRYSPTHRIVESRTPLSSMPYDTGMIELSVGGFPARRHRDMALWDLRDEKKPVYNHSGIASLSPLPGRKIGEG